MAKRMKFSVVGLPHYTVWHLYEPSVDDIRHMEEMEQERKDREKEEKDRQERLKKVKEEFNEPNSQWEQDKSKLEDMALKEENKIKKEIELKAGKSTKGKDPRPDTDTPPTQMTTARAKPNKRNLQESPLGTSEASEKPEKPEKPEELEKSETSQKAASQKASNDDSHSSSK